MVVPIIDDNFEDTPIVSIFSDMGLFFCTLCCTPCVLARLQAGIRGAKKGFNCLEFISSYFLFPCCLWKVRKQCREKYERRLQSPAVDQFVAVCCALISINQMALHMQKENNLPPTLFSFKE